MRILVDAMGGDNAPKAVVEGAVLAAKEYREDIVLVGREEEIRRYLVGAPENVSVVHADEAVDMHDDPTRVLRTKKHSSMAVALTMLRNNEGDALVSAGSSGALLTGATLFAKRIPGVKRGALAPLMPTKTGNVLLVDGGANTECTPEYLLQFGCMGSIYMKKVQGIAAPRVALLNNGTEDTKGCALQKEAYRLLQDAGERGLLHFIGNVEARDVPMGICDVLVADGFSGNIFLKSVEGTAMYIGGLFKNLFLTNGRTKLAYLLVKPFMKDFKRRLSYEETGGAPFIGISKGIIKAHGAADANAVKNAVRQAIQFCGSGVIEEISRNIQDMTEENEENKK